MKTLRLLPIVLFATSSLLLLKVVGLATGAGSFAFGPAVAEAAGGGEHGGGGEGGHGAAKPADAESIEDPIIMGEPLDLAKEAAALAKEQEKGHGGGGHGEAAPAHGEAAPAEGGHGEAAPAKGGHGEAAPAEAGHGEAAPAEGGHGEAAPPPEAAHGEAAAPAAGEHAAAPAAEHGAAPAAGGHGEAAAGGHGAGPKLPEGVSTTRPEEYKPPESESQQAVLEALAKRRLLLDDREKEIDLRMKLLQAAEQKLQQRVDELKSIQGQLGAVPGAGGDPSAAPGGTAPAAGGATPAPATAAGPESEQLKSLVAMYEAMKPKAAADVFDTLDLTVLVAIARNMNPRKLSPILAAMQPAHAAKVTIALAGDPGPREIVIRTVDDAGTLPSAQYVEPSPETPVLETPALAPLPGTADPQALPKIGPAPSG